MQNGTFTSWAEVLDNYSKALQRIRELEEEKEQLLERLRMESAYRFCDNPSVIIK